MTTTNADWLEVIWVGLAGGAVLLALLSLSSRLAVLDAIAAPRASDRYHFARLRVLWSIAQIITDAGYLVVGIVFLGLPSLSPYPLNLIIRGIIILALTARITLYILDLRMMRALEQRR